MDLSEVCEVNSDNGAGIYSCLNHSHDVAKNYYNLSYCANFGSENGKFHLRIIDHTDTPKIIGLCVKHGAKNGTDGCWVINGNQVHIFARQKMLLLLELLNDFQHQNPFFLHAFVPCVVVQFDEDIS